MIHRETEVTNDTVAEQGASTAPGAVPSPGALALDSQGNLYSASGTTVRELSPDGRLSVMAGSETPGYSGDGGPATQAQLSRPNAPGLRHHWEPGDRRQRCHSPGFAGGRHLDVAGWRLECADRPVERNDHASFRRPRQPADLGVGLPCVCVSPSGVTTTLAGNGQFPITFAQGSNAVVPALGTGLGAVQSVTRTPRATFSSPRFARLWVSPDGLLHRSTHRPASLFVDRDGTLLGVEGQGHVNRYTPVR